MLQLRITSSRAPYRRAGLTFKAEGEKTVGVVVTFIDGVTAAGLNELLSDPHLDVIAGAYVDDHGFVGTPVLDAEHLAELRAQFDAMVADDDFIGFSEDAGGMQDAGGAPLATFAPSPPSAIVSGELIGNGAGQALPPIGRPAPLYDVLGVRLDLEAGRPDDDSDDGSAIDPPAAQVVAEATGQAPPAAPAAEAPIDPPAAQLIAEATAPAAVPPPKPKPRRAPHRTE